MVFTRFTKGVLMSEDTKVSANWIDRTPRATIVVLGVSVIAAVWGWSEVYGAKAEVGALKGELAAVGLDASTADTLNVSLADKKRQLIRVENALVAFSAASNARQQQISTAAARLDKIETAAASATKAEREASAIFSELDPKNRDLSRRVLDLENSLTALTAAVGARRGQLDELIADVETNATLVAEANAWKLENQRLTAAQERLTREVVGLENSLVSLAAAVDFRRTEVSKALLAKSNAETEHRLALNEALDLRAEANALTKAIDELTDERAKALRLMVEANNRLVPALAAVKAREGQLQKLNTEVAELSTENQRLSEVNGKLSVQLAAADDRLVKLSDAAKSAAQHLAAIDQLLGAPTVQAALAP